MDRGYASVHAQYKFDEPWDSPSNLAMLNANPDIYGHPDAEESEAGNAAYFVLTGPETAFSGKEGVQFKEITDGASKTLLVVEARRDVPWTKQDDVPYAADKPLPKLGGFAEGGFNAVWVSGSVRTVPDTIEEKTLRALITKAAGDFAEFP